MSSRCAYSFYLIITTILLFVDCDNRTPSERLKCINDGVCYRPDLETLKFFLLGDTGGLPVYPYTTYNQNRVAKAISSMGEEKKTEFQLLVGDNIYYNGVEDVFDERFESTFEDAYHGEALQKPWYMIGGNHDHFGNISAQIAYTNRSSRWTYPSLYYKISYRFGPHNTSVEFIMIDTIVLCGNTRDVEGAGFFQMILADVSADPDDPKDPQAAEEQLGWIERQLNESKADYLFVAGHYPIYSIADHGPMKCPLEKVNPLLKKYKVSAYFAGHDHTLQHLMVKNDDSPLESDTMVKNDDSPLEGEIMIKHDDSPLEAEMLLEDETEPSIMHYIVSGAGSRTDRSRKHENDVPAGSLLYSYPTGFNPFSQLGFSNGGFVFAEISNESAVFKFFNGLNEQKYECSIPPRTFH